MKAYLNKNNWTVMVDDLDLASATSEDINTIGRYLATNTLVVIRNQKHLSVRDEVRVADMFGHVEDLSNFGSIPPYCYIVVPDSSEKVARVTGELDEHGEPGLFGHVSDLDWHCNQPAMPTRKPLVWLYSVKGSVGSRTSWTNNILAYKDLSDDWKEKIKDLKMVCGWKKDVYSEFDFGRFANKTEDFNENYNPSLVYTNNGNQTGLFFPFLQFRNFVGLTEKESLDIIEPLKNHVLQEKYMYHHDWQDGDVVIAEQWLGIHKRWRFDGMTERVLHRICFGFENIDLSDL